MAGKLKQHVTDLKNLSLNKANLQAKLDRMKQQYQTMLTQWT